MADQELLTDSVLAQGLAALPDWARDDAALVRAIEAPSFPAAIDLVRDVALHAESVNHHPDIDIRWRTVTFRVSTHSAGGLTALDLALAAAIDRLAAQISQQ